jgi:hypothetical protein
MFTRRFCKNVPCKLWIERSTIPLWVPEKNLNCVRLMCSLPWEFTQPSCNLKHGKCNTNSPLFPNA